jgi:hypothetical protein
MSPARQVEVAGKDEPWSIRRMLAVLDAGTVDLPAAHLELKHRRQRCRG